MRLFLSPLEEKVKNMFAVIKTGGKQYVVKEGDVLSIEKLEVEPGQKILFAEVLLVETDGKTLIGTPVVAESAVVAEVLKNFKDEKVLVFKKKRRKQYRRTRGHRQQLTEIKIIKIHPDTAAVLADDLKFETVKPAAPPAVAASPAPAKRAPKPPKPKVEPEEKPSKSRKADKPKAKAAAKSAPVEKPKARKKKTSK
jgi:large subunit ribosomal protein L21